MVWLTFPRPRTGPTAQIFSAVAPYTFVAGFVAASSLIPGGSGSLSVSLPCKEAGLGPRLGTGKELELLISGENQVPPTPDSQVSAQEL